MTEDEPLIDKFRRLKPSVDETLSLWYLQRDEGIPESKRIQLTKEQLQSIAAQDELDQLVESRLNQIAIASELGKANRSGAIFTARDMKHLIPGANEE